MTLLGKSIKHLNYKWHQAYANSYKINWENTSELTSWGQPDPAIKTWLGSDKKGTLQIKQLEKIEIQGNLNTN